MAGVTVNSPETQVSGGFRLEVSSDEFSVAEATSTRTRLWTSLLYAVVFGYILVSAAFSASSIITIGVLFLAGALQYLFVGVHNLRCTRDYLQVIDVIRGRTTRTRSFLRTEVKDIRFGAVSFSRYGSIGGLIFEVAGKKIKALYGLRCIEAQKILDELQRLGFDVCRDVGMPMMIEMERSRRSSWLGRWFG